MTTNVILHSQLVNYAKALSNYIKTVDLATRKYLVMLPRQRLRIQAAANLLVYS